MGAPKPLSQPRFEALLYRRATFTQSFFRELEWWTLENERLISAITLDLEDDDYAYIVLGRDETGVFRGVANMVSFTSLENARTALFGKMAELSRDSAQEFPQDDNNRKKHEILVPCVPADKLQPNFKILVNDDGYSPARGIIKELSFAFTDLDGNFRENFQTKGFDPRLWELYLYAAFYEQRFEIDDQHAVPDFIIEGPGGKLAIEAVTVNPTPNVEAPVPKTREEEFELSRDYMPLKWGSALFSKLNKEYWKQDHIKDLPLAFAIHDFHAPGSMVWSIHALKDYVFGVRNGEDGVDYPVEFYNWGNKKNIPAGFFRQPGAENVSAVIASNEATLTKFNRMGRIAGFGNPDIAIGRKGAVLDLKTNKVEPFGSMTEVGRVDEKWSWGLQVFHNPNAKHPLPLDFFPEALNVYLDQDGQRNHLSTKRYHIVRSVSHIIRP